MTRTTRRELDALATIINGRLGLPLEPTWEPDDRSFAVTWAYGQPRLYRDGGSVEVSPRLPSGQLAMWMRAFIAGIDEKERANAAHAV